MLQLPLVAQKSLWWFWVNVDGEKWNLALLKKIVFLMQHWQLEASQATMAKK